MRRRKEEKKRSAWIFKMLKALTVAAIVVGASLLIIGLIFAIYVEKNIEKSIDEELFVRLGSGASSKLYYYDFTDRENREGDAVQLEEELYGGYRCEYVNIDRVPDHLINAFISIEDKRFYQHSGVDWMRSISAGVNYFLKFNDSYGGSTITQQLIKNVTEKDEYSFQRKIQEIFWALDLEEKMEKDEILEMYLNVINFSEGCYGVGAASKYYFSKDVSELTLPEGACIAAITNSPTFYNPIRNPENNKKRRDVILREMYAQGYISEDELNSALATPIELDVYNGGETNPITSWYVDMVVEDVINDLMKEMKCTRQAATLMVYTGGLNIYTAMDINVQARMEEYYKNENNFYIDNGENSLQSSMIVIDPKTGDILGVVGGIGEKSANRVQNFATQTLRPAGSVIKPLSVYAPALDKGIINWASVYDDVPVRFEESVVGGVAEYKAWPKNSNNVYGGLTNINSALTHSINTVSVRVLDSLGLDASFSFLRDKLHLASIIESKELASGEIITDKDYAALALGQFNYGVSVRDITAAYSTLANGGVYNYSRSYLKVTDMNGKTVLDNDYKGEIVLGKSTATLMTMMLENVIKEGTGNAVTLDDIVECAGKTGTTQNNCDRWFIGYTPYYICGVWYGYEYPKSLYHIPANSSVKIWNDVMTSLHEDLEGEGALMGFEQDSNIVEAEYCKDSGLLMTDACHKDPRGDRSERGYFVKGKEPSRYCATHVSVLYDTLNGGVASADCAPENLNTVGLINVIRIFPTQIYVTDAEYTWRDIGNSVPATSTQLPFYASILEEGEYCGISNSKNQYNRLCRMDFRYPFRKRE